MEELLTVKQVCNLLKISRRTLFNMRKEGKIPFVLVSKRLVRFKKGDVLNLVQKNTVKIEPEKENDERVKEIVGKILRTS